MLFVAGKFSGSNAPIASYCAVHFGVCPYAGEGDAESMYKQFQTPPNKRGANYHLRFVRGEGLQQEKTTSPSRIHTSAANLGRRIPCMS